MGRKKIPKVHLSKEDKEIFKEQASKMNPLEFLQLYEELEVVKNRFTKADWKFMMSHMGRRAERFLRNVVKYQDFMGDPKKNKGLK